MRSEVLLHRPRTRTSVPVEGTAFVGGCATVAHPVPFLSQSPTIRILPASVGLISPAGGTSVLSSGPGGGRLQWAPNPSVLRIRQQGLLKHGWRGSPARRHPAAACTLRRARERCRPSRIHAGVNSCDPSDAIRDWWVGEHPLVYDVEDHTKR